MIGPRRWMAHEIAAEKRTSDLRIVLQGILGFLILMAACIVWPAPS